MNLDPVVDDANQERVTTLLTSPHLVLAWLRRRCSDPLVRSLDARNNGRVDR
jgi:hypothetical protein